MPIRMMSGVPAAPIAVPGEVNPGIARALVLPAAAQRCEAASLGGLSFLAFLLGLWMGRGLDREGPHFS